MYYVMGEMPARKRSASTQFHQAVVPNCKTGLREGTIVSSGSVAGLPRKSLPNSEAAQRIEIGQKFKNSAKIFYNLPRNIGRRKAAGICAGENPDI